MKPVLYRYKDTESVIKVMDGYTPGDGWEPLYSHDQVDQLQAQLVRQQKSYEAEIKVEIDSALERAALVCDDGALVQERDRLLRGEYICKRCGLRKDSEHAVEHDF